MLINYTLLYKGDIVKNILLILSFFASSFYLPNLMAFELGVGVRPLGLVEFGKKFGDSFNVRIAVAADYESGDIEFSSSEEIEIESFLPSDIGQWSASYSSLLVDYHPWQGNFRLTFGLADSSVSWVVENSGVESFLFNGETFTNSIVESTELEVQFTDGMSPYVGMGWATGFDKVKGFSFNGDVGVLAVSDFFILFDANCIEGQILTSACELVKQNAREELITLQSEEMVDLLPVLGLGISYKF